MLQKVRIFLEMIKFSHTVFALPFALLAAAIASRREGGWRLWDLVGVVLCMVFARTAAMGFNRWADADVDALNPRTKIRAIPAGALKRSTVLLIVVVASVLFIASTGLFYYSSGNLWPLLLSVPVLGFLFGYSYTKRFTSLAHVWLGAALAIAPSAAWIAVRGELAWPPVLLGMAIVCWVTGFDVLYACQDLDVDRALGLQSIPVKLGFEGAMQFARLAHLATVAALVAFGWFTPELGAAYWIGCGFVAALLAVEHWLVRGRDLLHINVAFLYVNGVISVGLLAVSLVDLYLLRR